MTTSFLPAAAVAIRYPRPPGVFLPVPDASNVLAFPVPQRMQSPHRSSPVAADLSGDEPVSPSMRSGKIIRVLEHWPLISDASGNINPDFVQTIVGWMREDAWVHVKIANCNVPKAWVHLMNVLYEALRSVGLGYIFANPSRPWEPCKRLVLSVLSGHLHCEHRFCFDIDTSVIPADSPPTSISSLMGDKGPIWDSLR